jgi:hypothetical protein
MRWTIKSVTFRPFNISNEIPTNGPYVQLLLLWIIYYHFRWHPQTRICRKLGFKPFHNSNGILGTTLVGTRFNIYTLILSASIHKDLGRLELLSILYTIFNNVRFLLSATPFWSSEPDMVYWETIPCS